VAETRKADALEVVYGMVVGGLVSSFIALAVFTLLVEKAPNGTPPLAAAISGLVAAALLMAGGMYAADRLPWVGTSLLFASGFTALWSVILSFATEQRAFTLLVLGVVIVAGAWLGRRRFGSMGTDATPEAGARGRAADDILAQAPVDRDE
jgi:hypothetical protein